MKKDEEYMKIYKKNTSVMKLKENTKQIISYGMTDIYIYYKIKRGMYCLTQAVRPAYDFIKEQLAPDGYNPDLVSKHLDTKKGAPSSVYVMMILESSTIQKQISTIS